MIDEAELNSKLACKWRRRELEEGYGLSGVRWIECGTVLRVLY